MSTLPPELFTTVTLPTFQRTRYGKTYDYDFVTHAFIDDGSGPPPLIEQLDTTASLAQAIEKIWRTPRYTYLAYDGSYGSDVIPIGAAGNVSAVLLLNALALAASDGAQSDPRVIVITDIDITLDDDNAPTTVEIECNVHDIFGIITALDVTIAV